jgi:hypothetical protein
MESRRRRSRGWSDEGAVIPPRHAKAASASDGACPADMKVAKAARSEPMSERAVRLLGAAREAWGACGRNRTPLKHVSG